MKRRSAFENLVYATHAGMFGVLFLLLRVSVGLLFLRLAFFDEVQGRSVMFEKAFFDFYPFLLDLLWLHWMYFVVMLFVAICMIFGVFTRPAAFFGIVFVGSVYLERISYGTVFNEHLVLILLLALFMAGGAGHVFGVNELVTRNIRRPKWWSRMLFG